MPIEMSHPFRISANGGVSTTPNPDAQIAQRVKALLSTQPGERRVNYAFGVPTTSMLFENKTALTGGILAGQVRDTLAVFEPGVAVENIDVTPSADDAGGVDVALAYSRREAATTDAGLSRNTNTAVISIGGTVSEIVRG
ncbi:GPW/gp25 family protein [Terracoccus sp. 273MFTsu3.1]|uniref:GPW/gp25 family protein n=1 Tax=Terracoccus sp. 273MFTsu3.1 TaxID=1172188 RepID=UPI00036713E8|nr:GPW/gp25 family protein [Terracoccus sp. 273MFTsu3.1]